MFQFVGKAKKAFTLIELLIVVAIIAILAAIAVPNFLEAQTRSKVSRLLADMRTIKTGIESYIIDANKYPETDFGANVGSGQHGVGLVRLTTPLSYLTSVPQSPFQEENLGVPAGSSRHATRNNTVLYVRALRSGPGNYPSGWGQPTAAPGSDIDSNYCVDRLVYLRGIATNVGSIPAANTPNGQFARSGEWGMKSVGPNNFDDRDGSDPRVNAQIGTSDNARVYDPTNGTVSAGDVVTYRDTSIKAEGG